MPKKIIAFVGETGSGKDTICNIFKTNLQSVLLLRFSDPLTSALGLFFDKIKKEDQQWLASTLRDRFGEDILMMALEKRIKEAEEDVVVLNGMRVKEEFNFIKNIGGTVVYVTAPAEIRWQRIKNRGEKGDDDAPFEKFLEIDQGRTEVQIKEIGKSADIVIDNSKTIEELKTKIEKIIKEI